MNEQSVTVPGLVVFTFSGRGEGLSAFSGVQLRHVTNAGEIDPGGSPAALLLHEEDGWSGEELREISDEIVILSGSPKIQLEAALADRVFLPFGHTDDVVTSTAILKSAELQSAALRSAKMAQGRMREVNKIGMALMSERDPDKLLELILTQARRLTTSDAGSLYLVEEGEDGAEHLHFLLAQLDSLPDLPSPDFILPLDRTSVAGYVGSTGETLVIEDAYEIPEDKPYSFNRGFDESVGYRGKSMLVVPMMDHRSKVVGVLQLINRKNDPAGRIRDDETSDIYVIPYSQREVELVQGLAGQAAVSIENGKLYRDIENVFEGFIKAAVTAIDQRDPTTSGHSVRVTTLTCDLAKAAHDAKSGPYKDVLFSREEMKQLRYAGLLHDFGKVGVREEVLVKMNKLTPVLEARVQARFDYIQKWMEAENERKKSNYLLEQGKEGFEFQRQVFDREMTESLDRLDRYRTAVREANTPRVLAEESATILDEIGKATFVGPDGREHPFLTEEELHFLRIPKGSLDAEERRQIEAHVIHSYNYLREIPWTDDLTRISEIVQGHHEKLNGKGYPNGISGNDIPIETRFMTVCDIFDALTASDRPYKKAIPVDRALAILEMEADAGDLDRDAVDLFLESKVYERVLNTDWREL